MYKLCLKVKRRCYQQYQQSTRNPKVIWEQPRRHPSRQRMDSHAARSICAMPTADESSHSAAGRPTTYRTHRSATFSLSTLRCPIPPSLKICPFPLGIPTPPKNHHWAYPTHHLKRHNWRTSTELLLIIMYHKLVQTYRISIWTSMRALC